MTQVIRTVGELEALDPEAMLISYDEEWMPCIPMRAGEWLGDWHVDPDGIFPLAVIATGEQIRAAQKALKEQE
ncbi:hypothetical protein [Corynebacterium callunae]|uniref:hypothetical protein n=1 Tax=Corynebacterium callunae TaxID=1721 RepID=UPI002000328B|nr:hypothetical protein [Corynebacterium callunae]MCK2200496.1 hypothetical protein [Corynebacterium callunae]